MKKIAYALLPCFVMSAHAAQLTYGSKPIHPDCFAKLLKLSDSNDAVKTISLSACSKGNANVTLVDDDYYRARHTKENEFTQYSVVGQFGNKYLIAAGMSTGGSGLFSNIIWAEKSGDQLHVLKILQSGDRYNGGADKHGEWKYAVNLTPVDLLNQVAGAPVKLDAYRDLDSSAASCVATAIYRFDPKAELAKFIEVKFKKAPLAMEAWVHDLNFQYCFNRLYNSYLDRGQIKLTQVDLDRFRNQFEGICMRFQR